jgi:hypothetical protein
MLLPTTPRRVYLQSFWLIVCLTVALCLAGALAFHVDALWVGGGLVLVGLVGVVGFQVPAIAAGPYKLWAGTVDLYCRGARLAVKVACFFIVFVLVGRTKSGLRFDRPHAGSSVWQRRDTLSANTYRQESESEDASAGSTTWLSSYAAWCRASGNRWALLLLPYLFLLNLLEPEQDRTLPANIYTLF